MTQKHTPTPWQFSVNKAGKGYIVPSGQIRGPIAEMLAWKGSEVEDEANAAYIVRCVNSHAALVEALETEACFHPHDRECLCARCKALAAVKGEA